jgi:hypothetical protein
MNLTMHKRHCGKWTIMDGSHIPGSHPEITEWAVELEILENSGGTQVIVRNLAAMLQVNKK